MKPRKDDGIILALLAILFVFGIISIALGFYFWNTSSDFIERAEQLPGIVVENVEVHRPTTNPDRLFRALVEYNDKKGRVRSLYSSMASNPPYYKVGESVIVLIDPSAPDPYKDVRLKELFESRSRPVVAFVFGFITTFVSGTIGWVHISYLRRINKKVKKEK